MAESEATAPAVQPEAEPAVVPPEPGCEKGAEDAKGDREAGEPPPAPRGVRLHVRNLGEGATTEQLRGLFEPFGQILQGAVKTSEDGKCKGMGFIVFASMDEATKALAEMNGKPVDEKEIAVELVDRKKGKNEKGEKGGKGKGRGDGDEKGKGKGKDAKGKGKGKGKGKDGAKGAQGESTGKGKGRGKGPPMQPAPAAAYPPYMYGMPPYGYGMYNPYMPYPYPYGFPPAPTYPVSPAAYQAATATAMGMMSPAGRAQMQMQMQQSVAAPAAPAASSPFFPPGKGAPAAKSKGGAKGGKGGKGGKGKSPKTGDANPGDTSNQNSASTDKVFGGTLKSISEKNGYGFIACDEAKEAYGRDVWVDCNILPANVRVNDKLNFGILLSAKGHPQAQSVAVA